MKNPTQISTITNPFDIKCVERIYIVFQTHSFCDPYWYASVKFRNQNTVGEQDTQHHKEYNDCIAELRSILEAVSNTQKVSVI